jgi:acetyl-CoA carboxylase biotin carboxyl carrier protein
MTAIDGRRHAREVAAIARAEGARTLLLAPMPGLFRAMPPAGALIGTGTVVGELEVLGDRIRLIAPEAAEGVVVPVEGRRIARRPVGYGDVLLAIDPAALAGSAPGKTSRASAASTTSSDALSFRVPMSGRYYAKPAPDAAPFVSVGDVIELGRTIALLEVMKTFNRVQYAGAMMPARAKVLAILPKDGDDVSTGDALLELEPA